MVRLQRDRDAEQWGAVGTTRTNPFQSLADALARADQDDVIFVLPEHAENITASNVFSGTASTGPNTGAQTVPINCRIIGEGVGSQRPVFTFTAAASTLALAAAGNTIENCILACPQTGTTTVAAVITISAAGCKVLNNQFQLSSSATALVTTGIALAAGSVDCVIQGNQGYTVTGTPTSWIAPSGTVGSNRVLIKNNQVRALLSATTGGIIDLSANSGTAPKDWQIADNMLANLTASSTVVIKGVSGATGSIEYNDLETGAAAAATAITTPGSMTMFQNFVSQAGKTAILTTTGGSAT